MLPILFVSTWKLRLGLFRALLWFGVLQSITNLLYSGLALLGHDIRMLVVAVGVDWAISALRRPSPAAQPQPGPAPA